MAPGRRPVAWLVTVLSTLLLLAGTASAQNMGRYSYRDRHRAVSQATSPKMYIAKTPKKGADVAPATSPTVRVPRAQPATAIRSVKRASGRSRTTGLQTSLNTSGFVPADGPGAPPSMGGIPSAVVVEAAPGAGRPAGRYDVPSTPPAKHGETEDQPIRLPDARDQPEPLTAPERHAAWFDGYWSWWWRYVMAWPPAGSWRWVNGSWIHENGSCVYENPFDESGRFGAPLTGFDPPSKEADDRLADARKSFRAGAVDRALAHVEESLAIVRWDGPTHEFRALVRLARGEYALAAAELHAVLAAAPGWDRETLLGLYPDEAAYEKHLAALEGHVKRNPKDAAARFVLVVHLLTYRRPVDALPGLEQLVALVPKDPLVRDLLELAKAANRGGRAAPAPKSAPLPNYIGEPNLWIAEAPGGGRVEIDMQDSGAFEWRWRTDGDVKPFVGVFVWSGGRMILQEATGERLYARTVPDAGAAASDDVAGEDAAFRLVWDGAADDTPALRFRRAPPK